MPLQEQTVVMEAFPEDLGLAWLAVAASVQTRLSLPELPQPWSQAVAVAASQASLQAGLRR